MKALELIEQIEDVEENKYHKTRTIIFNSDDMAFIREAKAELEALRTKSCDGCKYEHKDAYSLPCAACVRNCDSDYYEPKEQ